MAQPFGLMLPWNAESFFSGEVEVVDYALCEVHDLRHTARLPIADAVRDA